MHGNLGPYEYVVWEREVESLFYIYDVREEEKVQLATTSLASLVKEWREYCEHRRKKGLKPIKTCGLMNKALRFNVELITMRY